MNIGTLLLGQEQDDGGVLSASEIYSGSLSQLNIYSTIWTPSQVSLSLSLSLSLSDHLFSCVHHYYLNKLRNHISVILQIQNATCRFTLPPGDAYSWPDSRAELRLILLSILS